MTYRIAFTKQAAKALQKMPRETAKLILTKIEQITEDLFAPRPNATKLQNREGYRLRVGDWRVIYDIQKEEVVILVLKINLRDEVYR